MFFHYCSLLKYKYTNVECRYELEDARKENWNIILTQIRNVSWYKKINDFYLTTLVTFSPVSYDYNFLYFYQALKLGRGLLKSTTNQTMPAMCALLNLARSIIRGWYLECVYSSFCGIVIRKRL